MERRDERQGILTSWSLPEDPVAKIAAPLTAPAPPHGKDPLAVAIRKEIESA